MDTYIEKLKKAIDNVEISAHNETRLQYTEGIGELIHIFREYKRNRQGVYLCGNGGSAGIALHMTADFMKNGGVLAYSLYEQATMTCLSNDLSYEYVFSKQLELMAKPGELLVAISSSGESENIVKAIEAMRRINGRIITLTGFQSQNRIRSMGDINLYVPAEQYGIVESVHNIMLQQIVDGIVEKDGTAFGL